MPATALGWDLTVSRGPDSLWVKVNHPDHDLSDPPPLVDQLWSLLECHFIYRVVLDLSEIKRLDRNLLGQLLRLQRRIRDHGGLMRLCGLSPANQRVLQLHGLNDRVPTYCDLEDAVMGSWPRNPR